ncbi:fumarylacetoacetate hydrolase family protein [Mycolicibacterium moriokaense]|uniref:fumarylacetoacetate hydrolase family protein n=1 Tax=Mycolicibacterium moriokaense TaxID=39691 RepID=UPI001F262AB0|nr:fumarylacetoacetate hydrolase family protein [Mycolicibacterium moriokaense]
MAARYGDDLVPLGEVEQFWRDPYAGIAAAKRSGERLKSSGVTFVPPVKPSARVLCVGLNYADHVDEGPFFRPEHPTVFGRWTQSLAIAGTPVAVPVDEPGLDWEVELLVAVGSRLRMADAPQADESVFAYAAFNDITARRAQKLTTQWTLGKNVDNSGALSDLVTADEVGDPRGRKLISRVNGRLMQESATDHMFFGVGEILSFISRTLTLMPGDLVATGTPAGVGYARTPPWLLQPGDTVEVEVEGIGAVSTPIIAWPAEDTNVIPLRQR